MPRQDHDLAPLDAVTHGAGRAPVTAAALAAAVVARVMQDDEAAKVVGLGRRFCRVVLSRCGAAPAKPSITAAFDAWLSDARACGVRVVESFAISLAQDGAAVFAGLRLPWGSGQDEGQVNRLKLLKRSMYGRAKLDLLSCRFLLTASSTKPDEEPLRWGRITGCVSETRRCHTSDTEPMRLWAER